jgi:hypothetical protein
MDFSAIASKKEYAMRMRNAARTERASLTTPIFNFVTTPSRRRGP